MQFLWWQWVKVTFPCLSNTVPNKTSFTRTLFNNEKCWCKKKRLFFCRSFEFNINWLCSVQLSNLTKYRAYKTRVYAKNANFLSSFSRLLEFLCKHRISLKSHKFALSSLFSPISLFFAPFFIFFFPFLKECQPLLFIYLTSKIQLFTLVQLFGIEESAYFLIWLQPFVWL